MSRDSFPMKSEVDVKIRLINSAEKWSSYAAGGNPVHDASHPNIQTMQFVELIYIRLSAYLGDDGKRKKKRERICSDNHSTMHCLLREMFLNV